MPGDYKNLKIFANKKKVFIVKPEASSQGRGIFLIQNIEDINLTERYVVQEYITNPYLIEGLKFDLRLYVLVTGFNPLRLYLYEEGLTRLATEAYSYPSNSNLNNLYMHLTNYSINKTSPKFIFNTNPELDNIGHKRSLKSTFDLLEKQGKNIEILKSKIEDIIIKTLLSIQPSVNHVYSACQPDDLSNSMCFELLGFDIIIDNELTPFLLEVNHSPSFSTDSPLDYKIKRNLIVNTFSLLRVPIRKKAKFFQKNQKIKNFNKKIFEKNELVKLFLMKKAK